MGDTDLKRGLREARQNLKSGKVREALARLFHLTEKYPEDGEVKGQIAVALLAQGRDHAEHGKIDAAREDFSRSIGYSETPEGHLYLGRIHHISGRFDEAFAEYTRALDLDEALPAVHENLGFYFLDVQEFEQASKAFSNALSTGATGRDAYIGLWRAYAAMERLDKAHEAILDAVQKMPRDDEVLVVAGVSCLMRRELEEAETYWERAAALNPRNVDARFHLAANAAHAGRRDDALKLMRACAAIDAARTRQLWKQDAQQQRPRFSGSAGDEDLLDLFE